MKQRSFALLLAICTVAGLAGCSSAPQEEVPYDQHENYPVFQKYCNVCHPMERPLSKRMDEAAWRSTVSRMHRHDPNLVPADAVEKIVRFLSEVRSAE